MRWGQGGCEEGLAEGGDRVGLCEGRGGEDEGGLDEEGEGEGRFALGLEKAVGEREEEAAGAEGEDRDQGAEPEVRVVRWEGGGAEGEEDGVSCGEGLASCYQVK